ncbi:MAG: hypothetical protein AB1861_21160 [Cyanobacteriota bacterium]
MRSRCVSVAQDAIALRDLPTVSIIAVFIALIVVMHLILLEIAVKFK